MLHGRVDVDDELNVVDVHTAGGDVGRDEHLRGARGEHREVAVTRRLRQVAVQVDGGDPLRRQLLRELLGVVLRAHEQDAAARARRERADELLLLVGARDVEHVVGHRGDGRVRLVDGMQHLVLQEAVHELVDAVVQRRAEQHPLPVARRLVEDAGDAREESEVGHVVGLVDDGDLHGIQLHEALLHEVFESAGAGDDDVDAVLEGRDLAVLVDAAEDRGGLQSVGRGERLEGRVDLRRELAGRGEHETEDAAGAARSAGQRTAEARGHRDREGERLARAGLAAAEHVAAGERVGQGVDLDRERSGLAVLREDVEQGGGHAERAESDVRHEGISGQVCPDRWPLRVCAQGRRTRNVSRSSGRGRAAREALYDASAPESVRQVPPVYRAARAWRSRSPHRKQAGSALWGVLEGAGRRFRLLSRPVGAGVGGSGAGWGVSSRSFLARSTTGGGALGRGRGVSSRSFLARSTTGGGCARPVGVGRVRSRSGRSRRAGRGRCRAPSRSARRPARRRTRLRAMPGAGPTRS